MTPSAQAHVRTRLFRSARVVFQGGGCRAVALAGAYSAAVDCGLNVTEVAGASAGSILAALVGAGAGPALIHQVLMDQDFSLFLPKPEKRDGFASFPLRQLGWVLQSTRIGRFLASGGLHSSEYIEGWLEELLANALNQRPPIRFRDLIIPTYVVATDLVACQAKVWSTYDTPDDRVSYAVRCSCTIPGFYQAVAQGASRLVDGGLLSNLPTFVFGRERDVGETAFSDRILAFRLTDEFVSPQRWSPRELLGRILSAVVDGNIQLQAGLIPGVTEVEVPTKGVRATDFGKMTSAKREELAEAGRTSALAFFGAETRLAAPLGQAGATLLRDREEAWHALVEDSESAPEQVFVSQKDTYWFWKLFPSVLHWMRCGASLNVIVLPQSGDPARAEEENSRRRLLVDLGATVQVVDRLPVSGYAVVHGDTSASMLVVHSEDNERGPFATRYRGSAHARLIDLVVDQLRSVSNRIVPGRPLELSAVDPDVLIEQMKAGVVQYAKRDVTVTYEPVGVGRVQLLTRYGRAYKYTQIGWLADAFAQAGLPVFSPSSVKLADGRNSAILPPVLEQHGDVLVAIEGNTRVLYCWNEGIGDVSCLVVRGVVDELPARPVELKRVLLGSAALRPEKRMLGFNYDSFRRIEEAVGRYRGR